MAVGGGWPSRCRSNSHRQLLLSVAPLFDPASIAFIGASERPNTPASRGLRNCLRLGFKGALYPVNRKYDSLFGVACHSDLAAIPGPVDLAMVAVSAEATIGAVGACRDLGVKVVVVCSAGWEESGAEGEARAARLREVLAGSPVRLLGPNCLGAGNPAAGLCLAYNSSFESVRFPRPGRVGLITQSGAMLGGLILNAEDVGADVSLFAHVGNAMDIGMEDVIEHMLDDPAVEVLALMIEGIRQPERFLAALRRAREVGKPVVAFKAGSSALGREAVKSHTGALAGSDQVFGAICRDQGVIRVDEPEDLMQSAALLAAWRHKAPVRDGRLLVFTLSGGAASIIADQCETAGVSVPSLQAETEAKLRAMLPSYVQAGNPLDVGGGVFSDPELPRRSLSLALEDPGIDALLWVGIGAPRDERSQFLLSQAVEVIDRSSVPGAIISLSGHPQEDGFAVARQKNIPVLRSLRSAVRLIGQAAVIRRPVPAPGRVADGYPDLPGGGVIDEASAKELLEGLGIPVPRSAFACGPDEAAAVAGELGFPVVLKGVGVAHKSEQGLVRLSLSSGPEVAEAARRMAGAVPDLPGFLVEAMISGGVEVVVGAKFDPDFGPMLMFGLGGIAVELFGDVAFARCPVSAEGAERLISLTRAERLLDGFRGRPPADRQALVRTLVRISEFAACHGNRLQELDINPLLVLPRGQGVVALDALMVVAGP